MLLPLGHLQPIHLPLTYQLPMDSLLSSISVFYTITPCYTIIQMIISLHMLEILPLELLTHGILRP